MATWPASLDQSVLMQLTATPQPAKLRSEMDSGPAKQRSRFTAATITYDASMYMTGTQFATFKAFYEDDLGQGASSFVWVDPITDIVATLRFNADYKAQLVRPHDTTAGRLYLVTLPLEQLP